MAVAVDADAGAWTVLADRRVAVAAEVRRRAADVVRAGLRRHLFADVELVGRLAGVRVALRARDVAVVTEADAAARALVLHAFGVADEVRLLVGHAAAVHADEAVAAGVVRAALRVAVAFD